MNRWVLAMVVGLSAPAVGCSDLTFQRTPPPPPAEPPTQADDGTGTPPNWLECDTAWLGQYFNLTEADDFIEPEEGDELPTMDELNGYWQVDNLAFQQLDATLDFGAGWWPVDAGFAGDPAYFAVRWTAWIRAQGDTTLSMALGAKDDVWVLIDGDEVASIVGAEEFVPELVDVPLDGGQYSIEVRYAHRTGDDSGMLFRVAGGDVAVCEPEFEE